MTASERRSLSEMVAKIEQIADAQSRREARIALREQMLLWRGQARFDQTGTKLADAIAKFGGGSLLTTSLVLVLNSYGTAYVLAIAIMALLLFLEGTILFPYLDHQRPSTNWRRTWLKRWCKSWSVRDDPY